MRVAPTGNIFTGICSIKSENCVAKDSEFLITSVWTPDGDLNMNVCRPCLHKKIKDGEWKIDGALVRDLQAVVDIGIVDATHRLRIIVEIKNKASIDWGWVEDYFNRELNGNQNLGLEYFILVSPKSFFMISLKDNNKQLVDHFNILHKYFNKYQLSVKDIEVTNSKDFIFDYKGVINKHYKFGKVIFDFFNDLTYAETEFPRELLMLKPILTNAKISKEYAIG